MKWHVFALVLCLCGWRTSKAQEQSTPLPDAPEALGRQESQKSPTRSITPAAAATAQQSAAPKPQAEIIVGTVTDANNQIVPGATVVLSGPALRERRTVVANNNGFFEFDDLRPGTPYRVTVSAKGFANWTSPALILKPSQYLIVKDCKLQLPQVQTKVTVTPSSSEQIATEQVEKQEKQRVFGIIPNFYVSYEPNPVPLTTKLKFKLALKTSFDPVTILAVGFLAAINQAGDVPDYPQGAKGYAERFGAVAADGFSDIMIGGAILPSLLHQDPRYFYQGTGTKKSRILHAISSPFVCKGDNGRQQPNYSSLGGDLGTAALSNAYYPASNRGPGLVFGNFLVGTGERMVAGLVQEFVVKRLTPKAKNQNEKAHGQSQESKLGTW